MHSLVPNTVFKDEYIGNDNANFPEGLNSIQFRYDTTTPWADYYFNVKGGNDDVIGGHGDDVVYGKSGNDTVYGGYGYNELFGGDKLTDFGIDTLDYSEFGLNNDFRPASLGVEVHLATSTERYGLVQGQAFNRDASMDSHGRDLFLLDDEFYGFENVKGSNFNDRIFGDSKANDLFGRGGSDRIEGGGGRDFIEGNSGSDRLYGGSSADEVYGGTGNDYLSGGSSKDYLTGQDGSDDIYGGTGADTLRGGASDDVFIYRSIADSTFATSGRDVIKDFKRGVDLIDLKSIDADVLSSDNSFDFIGGQNFSAFDSNGELRYRHGIDSNGNDYTVLEGDVDGDRDADFAITFNGFYNFSADPLTGDILL